MADGQTPLQRAMTLAAVTGLKTMMGPALLAASRRRDGWKLLALATAGELVVDKLPFVPSRRSLPLLIPRALAGYYVAHESLKEDGVDDPATAALGAAVAAGVATIAPMARAVVGRTLGVPDALVGLAEDALALKLGGEAVGMSYNQIGTAAREAIEDLSEQATPFLENARERLLPSG